MAKSGGNPDPRIDSGTTHDPLGASGKSHTLADTMHMERHGVEDIAFPPTGFQTLTC